MICILMAGALVASQASHLPPLEFKPGDYLKQVHERTEYIIEHNIKMNPYDRAVDVHVNGGIGLIVPDGVFVFADDLIC